MSDNFNRYRVLAQSSGFVNGSRFTLGGTYNLQRYNGISTFQSNGMQAPDLIDFIFNLYLFAAFGSTGENSVLITPVTGEDEELAKQISETLNDFIQIQSKIAKMGRVYLEFGEIVILVTSEDIDGSGNNIKFYNIVENPYSIKRIEYKERLVGYLDENNNNLSPEDVLFIRDKHSYSSRPIEVNIRVNRVETEADKTPVTVDIHSLARYRRKKNIIEDNEIVRIKASEVFGVSKLANAWGILDLYSTALADGINNITQYRPKTIVTVNTEGIRDVSQRNDAFNKVVNSAKSVGSVQYIEINGGIDIGVNQIVESQQNTISEELDFKLNQASMFSFLSSEILKGEKSIFEDPNAVAIIKDMRGSVIKIIGDIVKSEFGYDKFSRVRITIKSNIEREWEAAADAMSKSVELMSSVSDMAALNKKKLRPGALSYLSKILGVEFNEILEDMTPEEIKELNNKDNKDNEDY